MSKRRDCRSARSPKPLSATISMPNGRRSAIQSACSGWRRAACSYSSSIDGDSFHDPRHAAASAARRVARARVAARMIRIALTGSIGMGKSTVGQDVRSRRRAGIRRRCGGSSICRRRAADWSRRSARSFPAASARGTLDRECLATIVLADRRQARGAGGDRSSRRASRRESIYRRASRCAGAAVRDSAAVRNRRRNRVRQNRRRFRASRCSARPGPWRGTGMTATKLHAILGGKCQTSEKRANADFVVDTGSRPIHNSKAGARHSRLSRSRRRGIDSPHARNRLRHRNHRTEPAGGDRMVEIGCVEIFNRVETGRHFHAYFYPGARHAVRGRDGAWPHQRLSCPTSRCLSEKAEELLEFIEDSPLVAHNAELRLRLPQS